MKILSILKVKRILTSVVLILMLKTTFCAKYDDVVLEYYAKRKDWKTTNLGTIMFKNIGLESERQFVPKSRSFIILQWRQWGHGRLRSVYNLEVITKPLEGCSVQNCVFTDDANDFDISDAVVVNVRHVDKYLPPMEKRNPRQLWIWMSEEPPVFTDLAAMLPKLANIYNWSMSYRSDSDVPIPYGRTIPLKMKLIEDASNEDYMAELVPHWNRKRRDVIAAILMTHCTSPYRNYYLKELRRHINVDVYGMCSDKKKYMCICIEPNKPHYKADCPPLNNYLFYLVFENSRCRQYLSEKIFYHAFHKGAIPVILGPPLKDCKTLLPPHSFLHVESYSTPKDLAEHLKKIVDYNDTLLWYHRWRNHFKVENEHGYFESSSLSLCRVCEALNYNDDKNNAYGEDDLRMFLEPRLLCKPPFGE